MVTLAPAMPAAAAESGDPIVCGGLAPDAWACVYVLEPDGTGAEVCLLGNCQTRKVLSYCGGPFCP